MNQGEKELPKGWKWKKLEEVLDLCDSGIWGDPPYKSDVYPVLRSNNIQNFQFILNPDIAYRTIAQEQVERYRLREGDILVVKSSGSKDHIGKCAVFKTENENIFLFSNFLQRLRSNLNEIIPEYLYYYLISPKARFELEKMHATSSGLRNIQVKIYKQQILPLPPLPVQERIVQILQKVDEIRRKRQEAVAIAEAILPAIFNEMFGDPGKNRKDLPIKTLQGLCTPTSGGTPSKQNPDFWTNGTIPWVSAKDMKVPEIFDVPDQITEKALGNRSLTKPGTVLIVVRGMILQHSAPICLVQTPLTFNQDIKGLIPREGIPGEFLFWLLRCSEKRLLEMIDTASHGTKKLDTDRLMGLKFFVDTEPKVMKHFAAIHRHFFDAQAKRLDAVLETEKTFNALLSRAFTGELTGEWEAANAKQIAAKQKLYQRLPQLVILSFLKEKINRIQRQKADTAVLVTALMKYVFLFQMEGVAKRRLYQFIPYHYGPFAKELYTDLETLQEQGLIIVDDSDEDKTRISLLNSKEVEAELAELPDDFQTDIEAIIDSYGDLDLTSLLATVYEKYPAYAKKSKLKQRKKADSSDT